MTEAEIAGAESDAQVNDEVETKVTTKTEPSETIETPTEPKPGTPDKALQEVTQEVGNLKRQIATLTAKNAEGELSDADKAKLAKAQERVAKIRNFVTRPDRNELPSDVDDVAEQVVELTDKVDKHGALEQQLRDANTRLARLENDRNWQVAKAKYAGLDVDAIWDKAQADADEVLGDSATDAAKNRLASKWFEERCDAAKKRQGDDDPKKKKDAAPASPGSYKVGTGQRVAPVLSETEELLKEARKLVVEI